MVKKKMMNLGLPLALAAVFVLIFGECNTPLGPRIGSDNAMYLTMGTALAKGYAPYSDIFDHKGPLLFLMQMLPQMAAGGYSTLAVYGQEVLFLFAGLLTIGAMARRSGVKWAVVPQLAYLACLGCGMDGGNLTEEYAATFILIGLLAALCAFDGRTARKDGGYFLPATVLGGCAMLAFLLRANNALGLCGLALGLAISLALDRRFVRLVVCAGGFIVGCAVCAAPVVAWLARHDALYDAFYGAILHNMMYAETAGASRVATLLTTGYGHCAMLLAALCCAGAAAWWIATRRRALALGLLFAALFGGMSCFISHKFYEHYLMVLAPLAAFGVVLLLGVLPEGRRQMNGRIHVMTATLSLCALLILGAAANRNRLHELEIQGTFEQDAIDLYALVPEDERDSFMAYRVEPKWYVYTGALPSMRFYFLQEILADADPAVMDEIVQTFETDPPAWLVIYYNREFSPPYDARVAEIFARDYAFVEARGQYQLLHRTGGAADE